MSRLALYLLGPPRIELDGKPVQISRRKVVALLAYLAETGTPHSRDALATLLWPERSQSRARAYLRRALSELNRTLGEGFLTIDRETAGLNPGADPSTGFAQHPERSARTGRALSLDVALFRELLAARETHDHPKTELCSDCATALEEAVELYCDDFMAGFTLRDSPDFDEWQFFEREALRDEFAGTLECLVRWHSSQREYDSAIAYARRWLALDPLHEPVHRHLMELYAQAGRRAAVERQYQECVQILEAELGTPPTDATTALYQQLQTRQKESADRLFPSAAPRHNLPVQTTPFIGREAELAEIARLLEDPECRLLTLVGPGGSGKTRLALEAAATQLDTNEYTYADGVFFVSLAPLEDANAIVPTVADALGVRFYSGGIPQEQLLNYLRQKNLLLIMDNYEHLPEGVGLVSDIIRTAPQVKILATSRARLNVGGEQRFQVEGMDYPDSTLEKAAAAAHYSAVNLFTQTARRARPDFQLTDDNLSGVISVCRLVQGMPLAIRLAAAWVEMLSPAEIAAEIRNNLDLLETERQDVPERQRSMRAAFDHSWNLLSEREIFQTLSVFRGPFSRHAAQRVAGATLHELRAFVDKSFLYPVAEGVYELHELLRQYAAEKLEQIPGAREAARDRHCAYYAAALERWAADLKGPRSHTARGEIDIEIENIRAAWNWAVDRKHTTYLGQAVEGMCIYCDVRRRWQEAAALCWSAVERLSPEMPDDGIAYTLGESDGVIILARVAAYHRFLSTEIAPESVGQILAILEQLESAGCDVRHEKALVFCCAGEFERSEALLRELEELWWAARVLFNWFQNGSINFQEAKRIMGECVASFQAVGDRTMVAGALTFWGWKSYIDAEFDEAQRAWEQSLPLTRLTGDQWGEGVTLHSLGCIAWLSGDFRRAQDLLEEAVMMQRELGDQRGLADSLHQLANVLLYQGQFSGAEGLARESIATSTAIGHFKTIAEGFRVLGMALVALGRLHEACAAFREGVVNYVKGGWEHLTPIIDVWLGYARLHLGQTDKAQSQGEESLEQAGKKVLKREIGLSLLLLGDSALAERAHSEAYDKLQRSLAALEEIGYRPELGSVLASLGLAALGLANTAQAREHIRSALCECSHTRMVFPLLRALPAAALLSAEQGERERAVEVYALASRYPYVANSRWFEDVVGRHIAAAAAAGLPPEVIAAAQERGRARDLWGTAEELLNELSV